jgi:hypothetical protein
LPRQGHRDLNEVVETRLAPGHAALPLPAAIRGAPLARRHRRGEERPVPSAAADSARTTMPACRRSCRTRMRRSRR